MAATAEPHPAYADLASARSAERGYEFMANELGTRFEHFARRLDALAPGGAAGTSEAELAALAHTAAAPLGETPAEFKPLAPGAKGRVGATDSGAVPLWASAATGVPSQGDLLQGTHRAAAAVAGAGSAAASWGVPLAFGSPDTMATPVWPGFGAAEAAPVSEALATAKHAQQQWHAAAGDAVSAVHGQQAHLQPAMQAVNSPLLQAAQQQPFGQSSTRTPGTHPSTFVAAPEATAAPPATTVESLFMGQQQQQQPSAAAAPASP
eukprot:CAMPEP_0119184308 /NCGR_PEP_ID=MMETSP1315-20130426/66157_1 /TAXON_ID=676789 /ORGANISM="Prasinoderma singularis, Strain RCC927" /LENGTH=264 /DNA_ID=CAMNT_0007178713 /DNA_START=229 /DNA_END=1020 /DNA_ORIENTATION=-